MMRKFALMLAAGLLMLVTYPANAADFTFDVPVELSSVSAEVTGVNIGCTAYRYSNLSNPGAGTRTPISLGPVTAVPLTAARSYSGIIHIEVNTEPGRRPSEANGYECLLHFITTWSSGRSIDILDRLPAAAGPPPVIYVRALFPATR